MSNPYASESNDHFADPDAVIPGISGAPPAPGSANSSSTTGLPPSSSFTTDHISLTPTAPGITAPGPIPTGPSSEAGDSTSNLSINTSVNQSFASNSTGVTAASADTRSASGAGHPANPHAAGLQIPNGSSGAHATSAPAVHIPGTYATTTTAVPIASSGVKNTAPVSASSATASTSAATSSSAAKPSILRRKLTSFVGFSNLPQQWHQKSIRQGFDLNLLVIGESGLGKSTLLNTLFEVPVHDLDAPHSYDSVDGGKNGSIGISTTKIELNESGVKLRLSVVDTPGYGDHINNLESWKSISDEVESRFDQYLEAEESLAAGAAGSVKDPRIHACLFFIDPTGHSLKPLDVVVMKKLYKKVNIVPIIAKADTQTEEELQQFKQMVLADLRAQEISIFEPSSYEFDDEETTTELTDLKSRVPFAVIGSTGLVVNRNGHSVLGREYPWGVVEVMNEDHNDFVKLRSLLIRNHMEDLRERTNTLYEAYRTEKLLKMGVKQDDSVFDQPDPAVRQEEERQQHEQRLAKMETEMRAVFQQKVTEKETKLKSSETELFQKHREIKEQLDRQRLELEQRKQQIQMQIEAKSRKSMR